MPPTDLSLLFERPADGRPIVWLLCVPFNASISPEGLQTYGHVRTLFSTREQAWNKGPLVMQRLLDSFCRSYQPGDFIAWQGGDSLTLIFLGMALMSHGIDRFKWLRFIGLDSYMVVPVSPFECLSALTSNQNAGDAADAHEAVR